MSQDVISIEREKLEPILWCWTGIGGVEVNLQFSLKKWTHRKKDR